MNFPKVHAEFLIEHKGNSEKAVKESIALLENALKKRIPDAQIEHEPITRLDNPSDFITHTAITHVKLTETFERVFVLSGILMPAFVEAIPEDDDFYLTNTQLTTVFRMGERLFNQALKERLARGVPYKIAIKPAPKLNEITPGEYRGRIIEDRELGVELFLNDFGNPDLMKRLATALGFSTLSHNSIEDMIRLVGTAKPEDILTMNAYLIARNTFVMEPEDVDFTPQELSSFLQTFGHLTHELRFGH